MVCGTYGAIAGDLDPSEAISIGWFILSVMDAMSRTSLRVDRPGRESTEEASDPLVVEQRKWGLFFRPKSSVFPSFFHGLAMVSPRFRPGTSAAGPSTRRERPCFSLGFIPWDRKTDLSLRELTSVAFSRCL